MGLQMRIEKNLGVAFLVLIACKVTSAMPVQKATGSDLIQHFTGETLLVDIGQADPDPAYLCGGKTKFVGQCGRCVSSEQCIAGFCCPYVATRPALRARGF